MKSKLQIQNGFVKSEIKDFYSDLTDVELTILLTLDYLGHFDIDINVSSLSKIIKEMGFKLTFEQIQQKIKVLIKHGYFDESPVEYVN